MKWWRYQVTPRTDYSEFWNGGSSFLRKICFTKIDNVCIINTINNEVKNAYISDA